MSDMNDLNPDVPGRRENPEENQEPIDVSFVGGESVPPEPGTPGEPSTVGVFTPPPGAQPPAAPRSNRTLWIILIVVAVLLLCCCLAVVASVVWGVFNISASEITNFDNFFR